MKTYSYIYTLFDPLQHMEVYVKLTAVFLQ